MSKIYETTKDLHREDLAKSVQKAEVVASNMLAIAPVFFVTGIFAQMIQHAQKHLSDLPKSKLWDILIGSPNSSAPKAYKWLGYGFAIAATVLGLSYKREQKKAENELKVLGSETAIVRLADGGEIILPKDEKKLRDYFKQKDAHINSQQPRSAIHSNTAKVDRLNTSMSIGDKSV